MVQEVTITQSDRVAAAALAGFLPNGGCVKGTLDDDKHVQAMARHRITATAALEAENAALRDELNEQARIVGMSAERELTLRAMIAAATAEREVCDERRLGL